MSATKVAALPDGSGSGRRIVFDQSDQRVWLVGSGGVVKRTYRVSGSRFDNLRPGMFSVQSRSRHAVSYDYSGSLEYFVRFATGVSAPIGFHAVPRDNAGTLEQTKAQLGTPLSAGCVRQWRPDAIALWDFAPVGTTVVVTD
ncbi:L,D-transpeptidase [Aeromicrobium sp.]|uniref:L,D-transpeptidase n=1 Tax=Aeromicrobium sp. TaxID=1871063 RepID=UPI0019864C10|nr:L,D-transpeptidase [Aeromicrobium sp.]MBC7632790.1 L,D-transpeptidase [Aeromicrobium sp.]